MHYEEYSNVERTRLASLLRESVLTLCRNGIAAGPCVVRVDGLIGVTLEDQRVVLVSIQESFSVVSGEPGSTSDLQGESSSDVLVHRSDLVDAATDPNVIQSHLPPGAFDADRMREQPSADMQTSHRMRVNSRASTTDLTNQRQLTSNFQKVHCCDEQVVQEMSRQPLGKPLADVRTMTGATTHSEGSGVAMEDAAEKILMPTNDVFAANMKVYHQ